jgi:hypothetical protein
MLYLILCKWFSEEEADALRDSNASQIFVWKHDGNAPFWKLTRGCEDNVKMNRNEVGWKDSSCIELV